ncbi:hypothetical protein B9Z19DRAFT_392013 [Tuber borchii]|uniref:Cysteine protease n=1 Tax=Tuber borchii TaxID=42251 RepID=A0A2T6ZHM5_TUBBO|nr:hypothetical protein B9Z19DRAFT_392013 [Tuber borchii]
MSLPNFDFQRLFQKFLWDPEPKNTDPMNSIWCLGQEYPSAGLPPSPPPPPPSTENSIIRDHDIYGRIEESDKGQEEEGDTGWPKAFLDDFESTLWMTYRSDFKPIPRVADYNDRLTFLTSIRSHLDKAEGFTSDSGWGCMIRSGQAVIANALAHLRLGREWRRGMRPEEEKRLLALFADDPRAPFSIHKFVRHGEIECGKNPGEWFGPSAAAMCIQALTHAYEPAGLRVYQTNSNDLYEESFRKVAIVNGVFKPTLVLAGIRLGIERITNIYYEPLAACLRMPQTVGIAGGRPSSSHYFIAVQGENFFYLDPHTCRPILPFKENPRDYTEEEVDTCHTRRIRRLHIREMDPSMLIAFLIKDEADWKDWQRRISEPEKKVIHISDSEPSGSWAPREAAIDEVEAFEDDDF